jgi:CRP-like cAMP-binding protein
MQPFIAIDIVRSFERLHGLMLPDIDRLASNLEVFGVRRRENAFRQGERVAHVYAVRSGLFKQLYIREDGTEWIKSFTGPGDMFACIHAITRGVPATFASVAIEPSVVECMEFALLEELAAANASWQKALRMAFQQLAELKVERERDLLTLNPRQRYAKLVRAAPGWLPRVPQKDLAAHLGVTPVGLSRIVRSHRVTATPGRAIEDAIRDHKRAGC